MNHKQLSLIASSVLLALSPSLHAQEKKAYTDEIVVTATRTEQSIKDVPGSVSKITAEDMEKNLANDLQDALKYEPGVQVNGNGRFGISDFTVRGVSGNRVKVMVDNVEQPAGYNPGADQMRKFSNGIEIDTLTAIEVSKGPGSSLYGSDAMGGTVLLRTKNPEDVLKAGENNHLAVKTGYASDSEQYKATVEAANRSGAVESLLIYTYRDGKETETHGDGADIEGLDRGQADPLTFASHNLLGKVYVQVNDANRVGFVAEYFNRDTDTQILSRENYDAGGGFMPGYVYTNVKAHDEDDRIRLGLNHEWQADNTAFDTLNWALNWQQSESKHDNYDHTGANGNRNRYRAGEDSSTQFDAQFNKIIALATTRHELTYGLNAVKNEFELDYKNYSLDTGDVTPGPVEVPNAESVKYGLFLQDQLYLMQEQLVVTAGIRYDNYQAEPASSSGLDKHESDAVTGRLGAVYHWNESFNTYAQISQGFRSPSIGEMYEDKDNSMFGYKIVSNPDLKPEKSIAYEIGARSQGRIGAMNVAAFYNDYKDFIVSSTEEVNSIEVTTNANLDAAKIYGVELGAEVWLDEALSAPYGTYAKLSLAYQEGEDKKTGDSLDSVAPFTSVVGLGYDAPSGDWGSEINAMYVASKTGDDWTDENVDAPSYTVVDLTTYYTPTENLVLRAGLFNAFDKKYWRYQDVDGLTASTSGLDRRTQPGRNWGVNLDYAF
ncbi:TonB-dependent hemoglobin/transferrin/lactoferrin family receptor [Photobacterium halotolerans]|uniref:Ligand-gated channel n=1 Tax=Photobacterium halotolerans TaxID=265726 RepID=A0A0F5VCD9_9GAMM|nr:TonB-dependent hemoglobin/transferrin/lactoferrin family receptor [Photobacterium halotolerans]KKC99742.1 ligand-gated channel [Photobacterium halotolerans]